MHNIHQGDKALYSCFKSGSNPFLITTKNLILRPLIEEDISLVAAAISESIDHMRMWMPWDDKLPELKDVMSIVNNLYNEAGSEMASHLLVYNNETFMGMVSLYDDEEHRGSLKLGYWFRKFESPALTAMFLEAMSAISKFAFDEWLAPKLRIPCHAGNFYSELAAKDMNFKLVSVDISGKAFIKQYELESSNYVRNVEITVAYLPNKNSNKRLSKEA